MNLCVIPAKGTSRRIPNKNRKLFHGKPMLAYAIDAAKESRLFDHICVSTEDQQITAIAKEYGAEIVKRPFAMAEIHHPDCGTQEITRHAIETYVNGGSAIEYACCLYPCVPMLTAKDLRAGYGMIRSPCYYSFVQVSGWYYWGRANDFLTRRGFDGGLAFGIDSERYIDINTMEDWSRAEEMYSALREAA